ncbi:MAG: holo-ACP synthase [Anaerolineae bacterium]|nr:holo-ACP synthase [Anaerolineae bacterium]
MYRIGVDMIEVARIRRAMERHGERFFQRFYTPVEQEQANQLPTRLAARFAAKEAVAKALGTGIGSVQWTDIEVHSDTCRRPHIRLYGMAAQVAGELGLTTWEISMTHTDDFAMAFVVASTESSTPPIVDLSSAL